MSKSDVKDVNRQNKNMYNKILNDFSKFEGLIQKLMSIALTFNLLVVLDNR